METRSLYVHIPFCESICSYCDFCKVYYDQKQSDLYLQRLNEELSQIEQHHLKTIYIGGGTPSALNDEQLEKLMSMLKPYSLEVEEYCMEVNPESMDYYKLKILKKGGINRLSIGVQTFQDHLLKDTRLTIIDKEGNVLADSDKEGIQENHSGRSEFKEALSDQFGYATRYSSTVKKNMMYVAYYHRGYVVRIAIPYNGIFDNIGPLLEPLFISAALSLCVALALSYRFSRTLTKPLEEISEEVSKINDNRYLSFDHYQYDEFNVIATKLKEQADTIRKTLKTLKNERLKINSILDKMNEGFILLDTNYEILLQWKYYQLMIY